MKAKYKDRLSTIATEANLSTNTVALLQGLLQEVYEDGLDTNTPPWYADQDGDEKWLNSFLLDKAEKV